MSDTTTPTAAQRAEANTYVAILTRIVGSVPAGFRTRAHAEFVALVMDRDTALAGPDWKWEVKLRTEIVGLKAQLEQARADNETILAEINPLKRNLEAANHATKTLEAQLAAANDRAGKWKADAVELHQWLDCECAQNASRKEKPWPCGACVAGSRHDTLADAERKAEEPVCDHDWSEANTEWSRCRKCGMGWARNTSPPAAEWYCSHCEQVIQPDHVTFDERHDERAQGCGLQVISRWINPSELFESAPEEPCATCGGEEIVMGEHDFNKPCPDCTDDTEAQS